MIDFQFKDQLVRRILPDVTMPGQYIGGELNLVLKDHRRLRGKLCLAFPDTYTIGMSHHGLQVLYSLMNSREDWACERAFTPLVDMETRLRDADLPLYSLETYTPLSDFDVIGFSLQYEIGSINVLTMLDLGRIPLRGEQRTLADPLIIAGGPCAQNPEPMAAFIDIFATGDGEPSLPRICDAWIEIKEQAGAVLSGEAGRRQREEGLAELARQLPFAYAPRFYEPEYVDGRLAALQRTRSDVPETIEPAVIADLDAIPLPTAPIVPYVECVHDRIAIEIMRGCPWQCRFCQSTVIKRPLRIRSVDTIVEGAWESYLNTGYNEISVLSLSSSDYPHFEELITRLKERFKPLGVNVSVPSLRVNDQLRSIAELIGNDRRSSLTLAPEVARDDMREQIRKKIKNDDLYEGCRVAFQNNYESVKLYFMCGLPGERPVDLDGIIDMAETIADIGKEVRGRRARVTASVSNFVPKAHTPYQWNGMQTREYFQWAHRYLRDRKRARSVHVKCHDIETSLLEGVLSRGDRRIGEVIELAWRRGARLDSWSENFNADRWWGALADVGVDVETALHRPYDLNDKLPWDHVNVKYGRAFLEKEQTRATIQLQDMADAK
ncbi:MAG: TIGR03960 family B12-binding radical SAM protein [Pirellulaceae bacterium]|nr:TIGR03960 family B12-binding radical SAM protein [Pirellulaceae bacterium]MDP7019457.1 TIGR03960 family B12-binding radical SAM protein [Pirellulaceae bacterium]